MRDIVCRMIPCVVAGALACLAAPALQAQDFPERDLTLVVPFQPGGGTDNVARAFATELEKVLERSVTVDNRPGGGGTIGTTYALEAEPDGYTILITGNDQLVLQPLMNSDVSYSPESYTILGRLATLPSILYVRSAAPWTNLGDFVAYAKEHPGELTVGVPAIGSIDDLIMQRLNALAGIDVITSPFSGGGSEALLALLGERVDAVMGRGPTVRGYVESGDARVIAAFMPGTYELFPDATSSVDAGYDVTLPASYFVLGPPGLPDDVRAKLTEAAAAVVASPDFLAFLAKNGYVPAPGTADDAAQQLAEEKGVLEEVLAKTAQ